MIFTNVCNPISLPHSFKKLIFRNMAKWIVKKSFKHFWWITWFVVSSIKRFGNEFGATLIENIRKPNIICNYKWSSITFFSNFCLVFVFFCSQPCDDARQWIFLFCKLLQPFLYNFKSIICLKWGFLVNKETF